MNQQQWAAALLQHLGIRQSPGALRAVVGWAHAEGGHWSNSARYNPLNTTQPEPGAGNTGTQGNIKVYKSWDQGLNATVQTLKNGRYGNIIAALRAGNPTAVGRAIEQSPWGTGGLAAKVIAATPTSGYAAAPPTSSYGSSSPRSVAPATGDARTQIALSLLGMGNLVGGGYGGGDSLTQSLIAAAQQQRKAPQASPGPTAYGGAPNTQAKGVTNFEGKPVAAWIKPYLVKARQAGWQGTVSSGFRSLADQTRIYNSGVRPAAKPGTSNHEFTAFPGGAVDVTDAPQLAAILKRLRAPLQWAGSKDPVHFSVPHNGSY